MAHMTRVATEARPKTTTDWITAHVRPGRRYRPPPGGGVGRARLRRVGGTPAGRYYQLLPGHAETGTHRRRFGRTDSPACWRCASGEPQSKHHLFTRCPTWRPQTRGLWKDIGEACRWESPSAPSVRYLWEGRTTSADLEFLRTTQVGCVGIGRVPPEDRGENEEGEEEPGSSLQRVHGIGNGDQGAVEGGGEASGVRGRIGSPFRSRMGFGFRVRQARARPSNTSVRDLLSDHDRYTEAVLAFLTRVG